MVKQISTARDTQRSSQSYMEKREEGDRGEQEEKRGSQEGRDKSIQESVPQVFSTTWNTQRDSKS